MHNRQSSQRAWAEVPVTARLAVLGKLRAAVAAHLEHWVGLVCACRGCGHAEALSSEVLPWLDAIQFLERQAATLLAPQRPAKRLLPYWLYGTELEICRRPWGTVLILAPGNYPLFLPAVQTCQALAAGNAVLLKAQVGKEEPLRALLALFLESGLPPGLLELLDSAPASAQHAIEQGVDKIVLTGSAATGRAVSAFASPHLTPLTAELSGADLVWVGPGADLELVARAVRWSVALNGGETCMAPRRVLCPPDLMPRLEELLGSPSDAEASHPLVRQALAAGAVWRSGYLCRVPHSAEILRSLETPVVCLIAVDNDEAGVAVAELSPFGLGASLFGDPDWARRLAEKLKVGFVTINDVIAPTADPRMPFGGRKASGFGVTRGAEGLLDMTVPQAICQRTSGPYYHLEAPSPNDFPILAHYTRWAHGVGSLSRGRAFLRMLGAVARERWRKRRRG